jgi:cytochrome P450
VSRLLRWPLAVTLLAPRASLATGPQARVDRARCALRARILEEVAARRALGASGQSDVVALLLAHGDVSDADLADELAAMLLVGHETTAAGMAWALDLLARHPAVQERLGRDLAAGEERYLEAVVREALRLRPPVIDVVRQLARPAVLDRWRLPVGTLLMVVPALVHRRADLYPDPGAFRPERFLGVRPRTYEWIPFGGGVRRCLGAPLAELEMRRLIGAVVRARTLQSAAGRSERAALSGTALVPSRGARILVR